MAGTFTDTQQLSPGDPITRLVHRKPVTVHLDTTLRACARIMNEESIGAVLVNGPHGSAGVLSERDIIAALAEGAGVDHNRARDFMTADVDSVPETASIAEAVREMLRNEIRHIVVSRGKQAIGLVSIRDVLAILSEATTP
jgi:CBS domain-containing protein